MGVHHPERVWDLLAYASIITKASLDYERTPWLAHDGHFQQVAAASKLQDWSQVEASLWTLNFTSAKQLLRGAGGLAVVPPHQRSKSRRPAHPRQGERKMHRVSQIATTPTPGSADNGIRGGAEILHASTDTYVRSANHPITLAGKACVPL